MPVQTPSPATVEPLEITLGGSDGRLNAHIAGSASLAVPSELHVVPASTNLHQSQPSSTERAREREREREREIDSPDQQRIASSSFRNMIRIWDAETGQMIGNPYEGHTGNVGAIAFSPDDMSIASGSDDHTIRIWDQLHVPV
ncbi:hypothetical protein PENSPDRAFT_630672 [Peniophora sp. CONT]|nr:hypothetical protein PENSPDRAFT_630672 [Peniophora sp. CONT]